MLIDKIPQSDRPLADRMLAGELDRQAKLKGEIGQSAETAPWLEERRVFQNYKQLQFFDTLALYFNRIHPEARAEQKFENVPLNANEDVTVTISPRERGIYALSPYPFTAAKPEFAYAGRLIEPRAHEHGGGWPAVLKRAPTQWERFYFVAG